MHPIHTSILPFSLSWWIGTVVSLSLIAFFLYRLKQLSPEKLAKWEKIIFALVIAHEILWQLYYVYTGVWDLGTSPPLHLCSISKILGAVLFIRYNQAGYEFLVLLGLSGGLQAYLTPEIVIEYSWFAHLDYYNNHGWLFFAAFYFLYVKEKKLEKIALLRTFLIGLAVLAAVGFWNYLFDGNYIFLAAPPVADNPLLIGEWPYYILSFIFFGFISMAIFYWIFRKLEKKIAEA